MNKLKLTVLASVLSLLFLGSCKEDHDLLNPDYSRYVPTTDFALTSAQQVPGNTSAGYGSLDGVYDRRTKTFTYKLTWNDLSSAVNGIHIHGTAGRGFVALPAPSGPFPSSVAQSATSFSTAKSGSYSGSLYVDNVVIKEADLLNGRFYIDIHTVNYPGGEIRGQVLFPSL
jgi:hypothetical protein